MKKSKTSKSYWKSLKMFNSNNGYPIQIKDPNDIKKVITDPKLVSQALNDYWKSVGEIIATPTQSLVNSRIKSRN